VRVYRILVEARAAPDARLPSGAGMAPDARPFKHVKAFRKFHALHTYLQLKVDHLRQLSLEVSGSRRHAGTESLL
jgi:hypothetical protein